MLRLVGGVYDMGDYDAACLTSNRDTRHDSFVPQDYVTCVTQDKPERHD
jgi:hypothetical protein